MGTRPSANNALRSIVILLVLASRLAAQQSDEQRRESIGEVLGNTVYRDEIDTSDNVRLRDELHRLFTSPIMQKYRQTHETEISPTESEIATATAHFDDQHRELIKEKELELRRQLKAVEEKLAGTGLTKEDKRKLEIERLILQSQLKPPGRSFAVLILSNWKFQRHLYDRYGGGRILWQQAGLEAFDAMHKWLESQERSGKFKIDDPPLRQVFYEYWTTMSHGAFLIDDKERIRSEFLEPDWMPKASLEK